MVGQVICRPKQLMLAEEIQNRSIKKLGLLPVAGMAGFRDDCDLGALDPGSEKLQ